MILFFGYFLMCWGVMVILYKYNIKGKLECLSNEVHSEFLYKLSDCEFCIEHHLAFLLMPGLMLFSEFEANFFLFPFMFASLSNVIKSLKRWS